VKLGTLPITQELQVPAHIFPDAALERSLLSISDICNQDLTVTLTRHELKVIDANGHIAFTSQKAPNEKRWTIPQQLFFFNYNNEASECNVVITHQYNADHVKHAHAALRSPTINSLIRALRKGWIRTMPRLTLAMVNANLPLSIATARGNLDLNRQSARHRKSTVAATIVASNNDASLATSCESDEEAEAVDKQHEAATASISTVSVEELTNHSDLAGRLPYTSQKGNSYILVSNYNG
jgi:hypothetical protein